MPAGTTIGGATPEPTAIGVPKWQTVGGRYVFKGTKYDQLIQGNDGKWYALDRSGNPIINPDGTAATDTPATDRTGNPIKLPASYVTTGGYGETPSQGHGRVTPERPSHSARYNEGDEASILAGMPIEQRVQVQQAMVDRGLAPTSGVGVGGYDSNWASKFKDVLAYANANGQTWNQALQSMPLADRTTTATVQANHYTVTLDSPQDLAAIFKTAASNLIGGSDVPQGMIDGFVRGYQEMQRQDQMAKIKDQEAAAFEPKKTITLDADGNPIPTNTAPGADVSGVLPDAAGTAMGPSTGGIPAPSIRETTSLPSAGQYAQDQIKKQYAGRYGATQIARQYDVLSGLIGQIGAGTGGSTQGQAP
jgi:hypothetical protein